MSDEKASIRVERLLVERIISGEYPPGTELPGERDLSKDMGLARPALREALQRLARDGWLDIQQGKPTRVRDFMQDGNLNILSGLLDADVTLLPGFVTNLLEMWGLLAPAYTLRALENAPEAVRELLREFERLEDRSRPTVRAQWKLHRALIELAENPIYGMVLNSFMAFYGRLATIFFADPDMRNLARKLWGTLDGCAVEGDAEAGAEAMRVFMNTTRRRWEQLDIPALLEGPARLAEPDLLAAEGESEEVEDDENDIETDGE